MTTKAVTIKSEQTLVEVSADDVKRLICPQANDVEIALFLRVCQAERLNPFTKEIYLIKYKDSMPAAIVTGIQAWLKAAEDSPEYDGHENGLLVMADGKVAERAGGIIFPGERFGKEVLGGWARVWRKDRRLPFYSAISYTESVQTKADGTPNRFWATQPATQQILTPLRRALKMAFPHRYQNMDERDIGDLEEMPDHTVPVAFQGDKETRWKAFYAKLSELGITHNNAQHILQEVTGEDCSSLRVWVNNHPGGLEAVYQTILGHVQKQANANNLSDLFGKDDGNPIVDQAKSTTTAPAGSVSSPAGDLSQGQASAAMPSSTAAGEGAPAAGPAPSKHPGQPPPATTDTQTGPNAKGMPTLTTTSTAEAAPALPDNVKDWHGMAEALLSHGLTVMDVMTYCQFKAHAAGMKIPKTPAEVGNFKEFWAWAQKCPKAKE